MFRFDKRKNNRITINLEDWCFDYLQALSLKHRDYTNVSLLIRKVLDGASDLLEKNIDICDKSVVDSIKDNEVNINGKNN